MSRRRRHPRLLAGADAAQHGDPELRAVVDAIRERVIDTFIADYPATLSHEPQFRLMLQSFLAFNRVVVYSWLDAVVSRAEAERLLADTLDALIATVSPQVSSPRAR